MKMVNVMRMLAFFSSFFFYFSSFAQNQCGTDEILLRNPFLLETYNTRVVCDAPEIDLDTAQVLTIPVVFHILNLGEAIGEGTNISDEQILSCIRNLNERFRGDIEAMAQYTNWNEVQSLDANELALTLDSKIEFCLATRDPNNNPTDGITRHDCSNLTYEGESYALNGVANTDIESGVPDLHIKELFHWPEDKYFNCYVVSEIAGNNGLNGIQGYSVVGSMGLGATGYRYGPVCLYNVTGDIGELKSGRAMNATWTHEIGHALNLYHTFGVAVGAGGGSCDDEPNPCTYGDQVPDTPPTTTNQSCNFTDCPNAILENYMDYTGEDCKTMFTQNQIERMRHEIYTGLPYLISSDNVSCQSPNSKDIAITSVTVPSNWCLETIDFNVKVNNFGNEAAEGVTLLVNDIFYSVPTIEASEYVLVPINNFTLGSGIIEVEAIYSLDEFLDNNTFTQVVEVIEQNWLEVILSPDIWSNEIDWEVIDEFGEIILSGGNYPISSQDEIFIESSCLPDGCYTFKITDSNGDGMCSIDFDNDGICDAYYEAFINVIVNENLIFEISQPEEINYGSILEIDFCTIYCPSEGCAGDFDGDGVVGIYDLLMFLATPPGQLDDCSEFDFNNDLQINLNDVLSLLNLYGTNCYDQQNIIENPLLITNVTEVTDNKVCRVGPPLYFDINGRQVNNKGRLAPGIYLIIEKWSNGETTTKKIFLSSWNFLIEK